MPYTVKLPPQVNLPREVEAGSPILAKPVRPVISGEGGPAHAGQDDLVAQFVGLPLDRYAREGGPLEVQVPWWAETLWWVPDERDAAALMAEGVTRGRIWTAGELMDLMACPAPDQSAPVLARIKLQFDGTIVEARLRAAGPERPARP
jgi:hypothetical protein